jgi:NitT/TauT family transport system permease protein
MEDTKAKTYSLRKYSIRILVFCFWIILWEIGSRTINQELFLPSPKAVLQAMFELSKNPMFWLSIANSFVKIVFGFFLGLVAGSLFAILSYKSRVIYELISPLMKVIKATPVASFIILALVWISSKNLSVLIAFMMVLPVAFSNVLYGLKNTDEKLLEMAKVFRISKLKCIKAIYFPSVLPFVISAVSIGLGFSFKSGIAAEVIGRPINSIGLNLYEAKLYLMIKELFAWTVVIILISVIFEGIVMKLLRPYNDKQRRADKG